jgi:hypothetical protein
MALSCSSDGEKPSALSLLGSANLVRPGRCPNGSSNNASRHRRLGKGASWRAQGWAGENGDRDERAMHPSQVAGATIHLIGRENELASRDHLDCLDWDGEEAIMKNVEMTSGPLRRERRFSLSIRRFSL